MQPGVVPGAVLELHAARARDGKAPGTNAHPQVAEWRDTSGDGHHGALSGFAYTTASGWAGAGTAADPHRLVGDGASDHALCGDLSAAEGAFTYEVRFMTTDGGADRVLVSEGNSGSTSHYARLHVDGGTLDFKYKAGGSSDSVSSGVTVNTGEVVQGVVVSNGTTAQLYVDGAAAGSPLTLPAGTPVLNVSAIAARIRTSVDYYFPGAILIARVYPFGLTADQVAQNHAAGYLWPETFAVSIPELPRSLTIAGEELAEDVEWESLDRLVGTHGFASLTVERPLEHQWELISNTLTAGAAVEYRRAGRVDFAGTVARLVRSGPEDPSLRIECRGYWAELSDREDFVKGFLETRWDQFQQLPAAAAATNENKLSESYAIDQDGQLLINLPNGTTYKAGHYAQMYLWVLGGLDPDAQIEAAEIHLSFDRGSNHALDYGYAHDLWDLNLTTDLAHSMTADTYAIFTDDVPTDVGTDRRLFWVRMYCQTDGTTNADRFAQIRNMRLLIDRTTAPTIPEAVYEAAEELGAAATLVESGTWEELAWLMWDAPSTPAAHMTETLARANAPVLCGIWEDRAMHIKPRPAAPDGTSQHWIVTRDRQPGMNWGVVRDDEVAKDYVRAIYGLQPTNEVDPATPASTTWPVEWDRSTSTNCIVKETGDDRWFQLKSNATELAPIVDYLPPDGAGDGLAVTAGNAYLIRCRAYLGAYVNGTARIALMWYDDDLNYLGYDILKDFTAAAATEKWYEGSFDAIAGATLAKVRLRWTGKTSSTLTSLYVRDVELRQATPAETQLALYHPSAPSGNAKVGLITLDQATGAEAAEVAAYAHELWSDPYEGPIDGLVGDIHTAGGAQHPVEMMRPWDWITHLEAPAGDRGPHLITSVHEAGEEIDLYCGGDVAFHYEREIVTRRGRYRGGRRVRKLVRRGAYKWVRRNGRRRRITVRKPVYKWVDVPGSYA